MAKPKVGDWIEVIDGGPYTFTKEGSIGVIVSERDGDRLLSKRVDVRFHYVTGLTLFGRAGEYTGRTFSIMPKNLKVIGELEAKKKIARAML